MCLGQVRQVSAKQEQCIYLNNRVTGQRQKTNILLINTFKHDNAENFHHMSLNPFLQARMLFSRLVKRNALDWDTVTKSVWNTWPGLWKTKEFNSKHLQIFLVNYCCHKSTVYNSSRKRNIKTKIIKHKIIINNKIRTRTLQCIVLGLMKSSSAAVNKFISIRKWTP